MNSVNTKEIVIDVIMKVMVTQRFKVPSDYQFDEYEGQTAYIQLVNDYGSETVNLAEIKEFYEIDEYEVCEVTFQGIVDVNEEILVSKQVQSKSLIH